MNYNKTYKRKFKKLLKQYKPGVYVKSHYQSPWFGIVEEMVDLPSGHTIARVKIVLDKNKNKINKNLYDNIDVRWLEIIEDKEIIDKINGGIYGNKI